MREHMSPPAVALWSAAVLTWLYMTALVGSSPGMGPPIGYVLTVLVMAGITTAFHRLLRNRNNAWAMAALAAPVLSFTVLMALAWWSSSFE